MPVWTWLSVWFSSTITSTLLTAVEGRAGAACTGAHACAGADGRAGEEAEQPATAISTLSAAPTSAPLRITGVSPSREFDRVLDGGHLLSGAGQRPERSAAH